jgi:hypothetical protein
VQHKNLTEILAEQGLTRDGDTWAVPQGVAGTVYLSLDEESLIIDRVVKLDVRLEWAVAITSRRERYSFELETLRALRFVPES